VPVINLYVKPNLISRVLSTNKICEGSVIAGIIYINGHIRQGTGNYNGVSALIIVNCFLGVATATYLERLGNEKDSALNTGDKQDNS